MVENTSHMRIVLYLIFFCFLSCDKEENSPTPSNILSKEIVEGDYIGSFESPLTSFQVSLKIRKLGSNSYSVELFESENFKPSYNSDGVTAEAIGVLEFDGSEYCLRLNLNSDMPQCNGVYDGCGTHDMTKGQFDFDMRYDERCNSEDFEGNFSYAWTKIRNF